MCGGRDKLGAPDWGGGRGQERACKLSVPQTAHHAAGVRLGTYLHSAPSLERANQRDLEIPESVFCG